MFNPAMIGADMMGKTPSRVDDVLASKGRKGDTMVAHISPREAAVLKALGGSGGINPKTGMLEFYDGGDGAGEGEPGDPGGVGGGDNGNGPSGTSAGGVSEGGGFFSGMDTTDPAGSATDPESAANSPTNAMSEPQATEDQFGNFLGIKSRQELQDEPVGPLQEALGTFSNFAGKYGGYGKAGYTGYSLAGPIGGLIGVGLNGLYDIGKNFDAAKEGPGMMADAANNTGSASGGYDAMVGANDPTGETAATPAEASKKQRLIYNLPYKFNRHLVGISARNIYPEKR